MVITLHGCLSPPVCPKAQCLALFFFYYNNCVDDLSSVVSYSTVKLFADDVTIDKEIACATDVALLQHDLSSIVQWAKT